MRGAGDLLGKQQSGQIQFRLIELERHGDLIPKARQDARLAIETADRMSAERASALALLSQLLSPDLRFSD